MPVRWVFSLNWSLKLEQNLLTTNKVRYEGHSVSKIPYVRKIKYKVVLALNVAHLLHWNVVTF